tara:strand:- start:188 stop:436 length:249 start_codon:yes stop_codon:yes gene_type:complete
MNRTPLTATLWAGAFVVLVLTCLLGDPSEVIALCLIAGAAIVVALIHEAVAYVLWRREERRQLEAWVDWNHARLDRDIHKGL